MPVSKENIERFKKAVKELNAVIADCEKDCLDDPFMCFAFLDAGNKITLLSGELDIGESGISDTILASGNLTASGGDW